MALTYFKNGQWLRFVTSIVVSDFCYIWSTCFFSFYNQYFVCSFYKLGEAFISQKDDNGDPGIFVPKPDVTFDNPKFTCLSDMDITSAKTESTNEKISVSSEQGNNGCERPLNTLLCNKDLRVIEDGKENLPPQQPLASKTHSQIPPLTPATPALHNLTACTTILHLDPSSPLPSGALKSQVESINSLCRQDMVSPTEMMLLEKESQRQMPKMSHRLPSSLLKTPVKDSSLVTPGKNLENTPSLAQCNTSKSAIPVHLLDEPNPVVPGIV